MKKKVSEFEKRVFFAILLAIHFSPLAMPDFSVEVTILHLPNDASIEGSHVIRCKNGIQETKEKQPLMPRMSTLSHQTRAGPREQLTPS